MKKVSDRFYQIKRKHVIWAVVKSAVCGISLGLLVTGVLLLALKLSAIGLAWYYYVIIGVGVAASGGAALFLLLFKPSDKLVAKRTDEDFGLNERVQTALEYSGESGTLIELQRADAEEKIQELPRGKFRFSRIWQFVVIGIMAVAIAIAGIAVPAKQVSVEGFVDPDNTPRQVTELERAGVRGLIADIEKSSLEEDLKLSVCGVLNNLLTELDEVDTEGTLAHAVYSAIDKTAEVIGQTLSYEKLGAALTDADQAYLSQTVTKGGGVYQYYMLTTYDEVRVFDVKKYDAANAKVGKGMTSLRNEFTVVIANGLAGVLGNAASGISTALAAVQVPATDRLYSLLKTFGENLDSTKSKAGTKLDDTQIQSELGELISKFVINVTTEVSKQSYNAAIRVFVSNRLKVIFDYSPLELPIIDTDKDDNNSDSPGPDDGGNRPDPDDEQHGGSSDSGETEYGSDDMIWVPGRGYMKYGDIIDEYYSLINQYLHSDELTEEQKNMIRAYYDILFGSGKNK